MKMLINNLKIELSNFKKVPIKERILFFLSFVCTFFYVVMIDHESCWNDQLSDFSLSSLIQLIIFLFIYFIAITVVIREKPLFFSNFYANIVLSTIIILTGLRAFREVESNYASLQYVFLLFPLSILLGYSFNKNLPLSIFMLGLIYFLDLIFTLISTSRISILEISVCIICIQLLCDKKVFLNRFNRLFIILLAFILITTMIQVVSDDYLLTDLKSSMHLFLNYPLFGVGINGLERAIVEVTGRNLETTPFVSFGFARLLCELGVVPILLIFILHYLYYRKSLFVFFNQLVVPISLALLLSGLLSTTTPYPNLALSGILFFATKLKPHNGKHQRAPIFMMMFGILITLQIQLASVIYQSGLPSRQITPHWTYPIRVAELDYRQKLSEKSSPTPKEVAYHRKIIEKWLEFSPHNELALIQSVRWAYSTMQLNQSVLIAREHHQRFPSSIVLTSWLSRIELELGNRDEAIRVLDQHTQRFKPSHPLLLKRLNELRSEAPNHESL